MSAEKSEKKNSERKEGERESVQAKACYTQDGFYRKGNYNPVMGLSGLSQKQSVYDVKTRPSPLDPVSEVGFTTLNPQQYSPNEVIQEQQYEVLTVFELNREREKNRILEKRLMNKQIHIAKMKEVHNELTEAFQKCQAQLQFYKRKCAQPVDVREYVEQINELKHLVIRLEDKITQYEKRQSKRYSSVKQNQGGTSEDNKNISNFKASFSQGKQKRDKRSKTVANQQDSSPEFKKLNMIEEYVVQYPNRITNFISQFMAMVECFSAEAQAARGSPDKNNVKRRLKIGWKWIKEVVVEWNQNKNYIQKVYFFHSRLRKIFNIADDKDDSEIMETILAAISN